MSQAHQSIPLGDIAAGLGGFAILGEDAGDAAGRAVASAGDVNGDGFADLLIGARTADGTGNATPDAGGTYVLFGAADGFTTPVDLAAVAQGIGGFVIHGEEEGDRSGFAAASAGDINGDGFDDLIIGAPNAAPNTGRDYGAGSAYVVFGKAEGFGAAVELADIVDGDGGFVLRGAYVYDGAANAVAGGGDINGDGFDDLIIGARTAYGAENDEQYTGLAYVVFGKSEPFAARISLENIAKGRGGFVVYGANSYDGAGDSVAFAGDVNGDGFDDLLIGAGGRNGAGDGEYGNGAAYVVFGHAGGFPAAIRLAEIEQGQGGFVILGEGALDRAGGSVAAAGDVNGDGIDDLIVGANLARTTDPAKAFAGAAYVVFGRATGFPAAIDLAAVALGQGGFVLRGEDFNDQAGFSVGGAGDLNGDGLADLVVAAPIADGTANVLADAGRIYVVFGTPAGFPAAIDLADVARGQGGFVLQGEAAGDLAGVAVALAGDIDGDGFDDLLIGASGAGDAGGGYVVFGGPFLGGAAPTLGTDGDDRRAGTVAADAVDGLAGDDRLGGGGGGDTLAGGAGHDVLRGNRGADLIAGGLGDDLLAGGQGTDTLAGGQGADRFRFTGPADGADLILDFAPGVDVMQLSAAGFGEGLVAGADLAARFTANAAGLADSAAGIAQFVFDTDDTVLLWDADGAGGGAAVGLARFADAIALAAGDLQVVA